jgi:hypothetical protein
LSGGTANGVAYLNTSKVLTTGGSLTWDGTNLTVNTGTVSATYGKLTVAGGISITPDSSSKFQIGRFSAGAPYSYIKMGSTSSGLKFTDPTDSFDLMTLDTSGSLLVGATSASAVGSSKIYAKTNNGYGIISEQAVTGQYCYTSNALTNGGTFYHFLILENGTQRGSITSNGTLTTYGTTSDYRLKDIAGSVTGAKDFIMALQPKQGTWKSDGSKFVGFLAHEFQEVSPSSVVGKKDAVDADGKPIMQAMQASSAEVMANLIALVQEQQALITQLTARITALEGA